MKIGFILIGYCLWWCLPLPAAALTVEEILILKQNGVSEPTIQMMLQSEIRAEREAPAGDRIGVTRIRRPDGQSAIVYSTGRDDADTSDREERLKEERAWEMLRHIIVDTRHTNN